MGKFSLQSLGLWLVRSGRLSEKPHVLDRQACGSSSGSAAAAAASLAAATVGTETNGSIICPSQVNGVVGLKPTHGLLPVDHIVPIAATQDTAGPITKSVSGAALMLDGMTGWTNEYFESLDPSLVSGMRVGVLEFARNDNPRLNAQLDAAIARMSDIGAEIVRIDEHDTPPEFWGAARLVLGAEFKQFLDAYLAGRLRIFPSAVFRTWWISTTRMRLSSKLFLGKTF